ncbi:MAG: hypothetical protein PUP91_08975 [Rhizonema sp. PD37]|nr:hypothetical protein [Rhizonema sp. PD37]
MRLRVAADRGEVPVGIVKDSPGSRVSKGGVFCWQDVCDRGDTALYLSLRELSNTEQGTNTLQTSSQSLSFNEEIKTTVSH